MIIAQATTQPADLGATVAVWVGLIVSVLGSLAGLLTAVAALLASVHANGRISGHISAAAAFVTHLSNQVNGQAQNAVTIARDLQAAAPALNPIVAQLQSTEPPAPVALPAVQLRKGT